MMTNEKRSETYEYQTLEHPPATQTPDYRDKIIALMEKNETLEKLVEAYKEENENLKDVIREFKAIVERNFGEKLK